MLCMQASVCRIEGLTLPATAAWAKLAVVAAAGCAAVSGAASPGKLRGTEPTAVAVGVWAVGAALSHCCLPVEGTAGGACALTLLAAGSTLHPGHLSCCSE